MAELNINQIQTPAQNVNAANRPEAGAEIRTRERQDIREQSRQEEEKRKKLEEERLDHVIAVSKDGDTVQASEESQSRLKAEEEEKPAAAQALAEEKEEDAEEAKAAEGKVIVNENTVKEQIEKEAEARERRLQILEDISSSSERAMSVRDLFSAAAQRKELAMTGQDEKDENNAYNQVKSFIGYSDAQLKQMYQQGEISKQDYDREIDSREEKREEEQEESGRLSRQVTQEAALAEENEREGRGIKIAFSEDSSNTIRPEDRVDMIQKANENFSLS